MNTTEVDTTMEDLHFEHDLPSIHVDLFPVRIFDGRVVAFDPDILHELGGEAAFTHSSCREQRGMRQ